MNTDEKSLLLAFTGADTSLPAVEYGVWLAEQINVPVTLLGIVEKPARRIKIEEVIQVTSERLIAGGIPCKVLLESGTSRDIICQYAVADRHLTIFGSFDRPLLRRWLRGRSFRRIFRKIDTPVLYVRQMQPQLKNILVCMGGLGHARSAERWALFLAQHLRATITLFHVVEPISYDYPTAREIQNHWENILETNTPQGQNLRAALKTADDMGIAANFKVSHGDIVHEIFAEVNNQNYDLIVMGSPVSSDNLRHFFMPNITAEIAENAPCPVLAASLGQEWIFTDPSEKKLENVP
jgi:nucleotide-binding universal stress UspA family protein